MTDCRCTLPDGSWGSGPWHLRTRSSGTVEAYERCPDSRSPLAARLIRAGVPEQYLGYTRDSFPGPWPAEAQAWLDEWHAGRAVINLYVYGPNGTGKTHLVTALLGVMLERGKSGAWCSAKLVPELDPERNDGDRETVERYRSVDVLVMDDLFSEGNFKADRVRSIAEHRYQRAHPTLYTSMRPPQATAEEKKRGIAGAIEIDSDLASRACSGLRIERRGVDQRFVRRAATGGA